MSDAVSSCPTDLSDQSSISASSSITESSIATTLVKAAHFNVHDLLVLAERLSFTSNSAADVSERKQHRLRPMPDQSQAAMSKLHLSVDELLQIAREKNDPAFGFMTVSELKGEDIGASNEYHNAQVSNQGTHTVNVNNNNGNNGSNSYSNSTFNENGNFASNLSNSSNVNTAVHSYVKQNGNDDDDDDDDDGGNMDDDDDDDD
jgi:hypothetical protein